MAVGTMPKLYLLAWSLQQKAYLIECCREEDPIKSAKEDEECQGEPPRQLPGHHHDDGKEAVSDEEHKRDSHTCTGEKKASPIKN